MDIWVISIDIYWYEFQHTKNENALYLISIPRQIKLWEHYPHKLDFPNTKKLLQLNSEICVKLHIIIENIFSRDQY